MLDCDFEDCQKPAVRNYGECALCDRHLCSKHLETEFHKCLKWEICHREADQREVNALLKRVDVNALISHASRLRNGLSCFIDLLPYDKSTRNSVMGGMNYHIKIQFEDGISWLARIRRSNATSPPPDLRDSIIRSEIATLRLKTGLPVPKVYGFDFARKGNPVGVGYMLIEKLPRKALHWSLASAEQRKKVMDQLADIFINLEQFPFELMGSLDQVETLQLGPFARESLTDYSNTGMRPIGPLSSLEDYLRASIQLVIDLIMRDECYTQQPIDACLIHKFLLDSVPKILSYYHLDDGHFYLKHADDKGEIMFSWMTTTISLES
ncbi:hypothetical protein AJ80_06738 [Polytolypa hystricis UAMH7299]|uniref:Aminoglycoside phosphotransferase domain-containing protein n=1 Tax=Polytolypa hystricis (strain UAMH7299) TaxID=1447883 RepID=A0A2B7XUR6_POLH7|nr:hypothetical protein AJ80_06738 [Polytolypa hystricis UAMH7299]